MTMKPAPAIRDMALGWMNSESRVPAATPMAVVSTRAEEAARKTAHLLTA